MFASADDFSRAEWLRRELNRHNHLYYNPSISGLATTQRPPSYIIYVQHNHRIIAEGDYPVQTTIALRQ